MYAYNYSEKMDTLSIKIYFNQGWAFHALNIQNIGKIAERLCFFFLILASKS